MSHVVIDCCKPTDYIHRRALHSRRAQGRSSYFVRQAGRGTKGAGAGEEASNIHTPTIHGTGILAYSTLQYIAVILFYFYFIYNYIRVNVGKYIPYIGIWGIV